MAEPFYLPELAITQPVNFHVENLGRIPTADFDIKPLTVFIGKANTNKTWTAYALYGLLRSLSQSSRFAFFGPRMPKFHGLDRAIEAVAEETAQELITAHTQGAGALDSYSTVVPRERVFQVAHPIGEHVKLEFGKDQIATLLAVDPNAIGNAHAILSIRTDQLIRQGCLAELSIGFQKRYWIVEGISKAGDPVHGYLISRAEEQSPTKAQITHATRWLAVALFEEVMAFPAERKGLAITMGALERERRPNISIAAQDYMRFLYGATRGGFRAEESRAAMLLEKNVMGGRADFDEEQKVFSFMAMQGPPVQINASASFVRSMAGLDLYLRTVAGNDVIVIDEPEMNAHPEAQLKLVELFAIMANEGRHVIVTTHSPYFVDHLNNLIQGSSLSKQRRAELSRFLKLGDQSAFINANNVSVYLFQENGETRNLIADGTIDLESFAVESDYVVNLGSAIEQAGRDQDGAQ